MCVPTMDLTLADPRMVSRFHAFETGRITIRLYDGRIPFMLVLADETALISPLDDDGSAHYIDYGIDRLVPRV